MICKFHGPDFNSFRCSIFEISVGWTGTQSIREAIDILGGIKTNHHFNHCRKCRHDAKDRVLLGDCKWHVYNICDYASNFPHIHWRKLAQTFPDAKFILPMRNIDSWMDKMKRSGRAEKKSDAGYSRAIADPIDYSSLLMFKFFGQLKYDENLWRHCILNHDNEVLKYFRGSNRLLFLNVFYKIYLSSDRKLNQHYY